MSRGRLLDFLCKHLFTTYLNLDGHRWAHCCAMGDLSANQSRWSTSISRQFKYSAIAGIADHRVRGPKSIVGAKFLHIGYKFHLARSIRLDQRKSPVHSTRKTHHHCRHLSRGEWI